MCPGPSHLPTLSWRPSSPSSKTGMFAQETPKAQNAVGEGGRAIGLGLTKEEQVSGPLGPPRKRMGSAPA